MLMRGEGCGATVKKMFIRETPLVKKP